MFLKAEKQMQNKIIVIDNFLDPALLDPFDFCTRYYTEFRYGRTSADYEHKDDTDSRYLSKIIYNGTPDPLLQTSFTSAGDEIFYRYVCEKMKEKWTPFFTYDSSRFFEESSQMNQGFWVFDIHMNFRSTSMTDQWHQDAASDQAADPPNGPMSPLDEIFVQAMPKWNSNNRLGFQQYTCNLMIGNNFREDETGLEIEDYGTVGWKNNRMTILPSQSKHRVYWKEGFNSKEMRLTYTMFGVLIEYDLDKYKNHIRTTTPVGPIDQHDRQRKHDYKHNEERNKTNPLLYKT